MKRILCFGDSNTFGHDPVDGSRLQNRWTRLIRPMLGDEYEIIEEGLCGRTSVFMVNTPKPNGWEGSTLLTPVIASQNPLDLIIIMLGTNDLLVDAHAAVTESARGIETLINIARAASNAKILIVSPILIREEVNNHENFSKTYGGSRACKMSEQLAPLYKEIAEKSNCYFLNAANFAEASPLDGVHMDSDNHKKLAEALSDKIKNIFK